MTDRIEPALAPDAWRYWLRDPDDPARAVATACDAVSFDLRQKPERLIALANAALPDSDPRKITRETVRAVLAARVAYPLGSASHRELIQIAAALASYLPSDQQPAELGSAYAAYLPPEGSSAM